MCWADLDRAGLELPKRGNKISLEKHVAKVPEVSTPKNDAPRKALLSHHHTKAVWLTYESDRTPGDCDKHTIKSMPDDIDPRPRKTLNYESSMSKKLQIPILQFHVGSSGTSTRSHRYAKNLTLGIILL